LRICTSDGTVVDVQILNNRGAPGWAPPLIQSISGRRYAVARETPASLATCATEGT